MDSGLGEFFQQIPTGLIVLFCGSGILLVFSLAYIIIARNRRRARTAAAPPAPAGIAASETDLPDLDLLTTSEIPAAPVAVPVSTPAVAPRPASANTVSLSDGEIVEAVEVLTVLRDVAEGGLIIRIGETAHRNPPAVADAEFKRRFHSTLRDLNAAQQPVERAASGVATSETAAADALPFDFPDFEPAETLPGDLPKFTLPDKPVKPKRGQRPPSDPIPEINIAASIESFLQHKLERSPEFNGRSIHVRPALHGGVTIEVDGVYYDTVGDVADADVRQYLATTIEEWQARQ